MKTINKLILLAAAFTLPFAVSCVKENEYVKGAPENDNPYDVYFEIPEATDYSFAPDEETVLEFTAVRKDVNGRIAVPFVIESEKAEIFDVGDGEIVFEDGEDKATFQIKFPEAKIGEKYSGIILIDDPQYTHIYTSDPLALSFSVIRINWIPLGTGVWHETLIDGVFGVGAWDLPCEIDVREDLLYYNEETEAYEYDNAESQYIFRIKTPYTPELLYEWWAEEGETVEDDYVPLIDDVYIEINATKRNQVWIDYQPTGVNLTAWGYGNLIIASYVPNTFKNGLEDNYGTLKDGIISFKTANSFYIELSDYNYANLTNGNGDFKILLPGAKEYDFEVAITPGFADAEGVMPVDLDFSEDVAKVAYDCFEGELTGSAVKKAGAALAEDKNAKKITAPGSVNISLEETGVYTFVAAAIDKDGKFQGAYSATLEYLAAGDEDDVVATVGLDNITGKYAAQGLTPEDALEAWIYGERLKEVKIGLFEDRKYKKSPEKFQAQVKEEGDALEEDDLELVNGEGYSAVIGDLMPGTVYTLVVWATNGYSEEWFFANATTEGESPLPVYQKFTLESYAEEYGLESEDDLFGTWNYYAIDYEGTTGKREYIGKVEFSDSETEDEVDDGVTYQYVYGKGFSADALTQAKSYGLVTDDDDTMEYYLVEGFLVHESNYTLNKQGTLTFYSGTLDGYYRVTGYIVGIPVGDGYYAFVDGGDGYNFSTWSWNAGGYWWRRFDDVLLVDPEKDDNGLAPDYVQNNIRAAKKSIASRVAADNGTFYAAPRVTLPVISGKIQNLFHVVTSSPMELRRASYAVTEIAGRHKGSREILRSGLKSVEKPMR